MLKLEAMIFDGNRKLATLKDNCIYDTRGNRLGAISGSVLLDKSGRRLATVRNGCIINASGGKSVQLSAGPQDALIEIMRFFLDQQSRADKLLSQLKI